MDAKAQEQDYRQMIIPLSAIPNMWLLAIEHISGPFPVEAHGMHTALAALKDLWYMPSPEWRKYRDRILVGFIKEVKNVGNTSVSNGAAYQFFLDHPNETKVCFLNCGTGGIKYQTYIKTTGHKDVMVVPGPSWKKGSANPSASVCGPYHPDAHFSKLFLTPDQLVSAISKDLEHPDNPCKDAKEGCIFAFVTGQIRTAWERKENESRREEMENIMSAVFDKVGKGIQPLKGIGYFLPQIQEGELELMGVQDMYRNLNRINKVDSGLRVICSVGIGQGTCQFMVTPPDKFLAELISHRYGLANLPKLLLLGKEITRVYENNPKQLEYLIDALKTCETRNVKPMIALKSGCLSLLEEEQKKGMNGTRLSIERFYLSLGKSRDSGSGSSDNSNDNDEYAGGNVDGIRVFLGQNGAPNVERVEWIKPNNITLDRMCALAAFALKVNVDFVRVFHAESGARIVNPNRIQENDVLLFSCGEPFGGRPSFFKVPPAKNSIREIVPLSSIPERWLLALDSKNTSLGNKAYMTLNTLNALYYFDDTNWREWRHKVHVCFDRSILSNKPGASEPTIVAVFEIFDNKVSFSVIKPKDEEKKDEAKPDGDKKDEAKIVLLTFSRSIDLGLDSFDAELVNELRKTPARLGLNVSNEVKSPRMQSEGDANLLFDALLRQTKTKVLPVILVNGDCSKFFLPSETFQSIQEELQPTKPEAKAPEAKALEAKAPEAKAPEADAAVRRVLYEKLLEPPAPPPLIPPPNLRIFVHLNDRLSKEGLCIEISPSWNKSRLCAEVAQVLPGRAKSIMKFTRVFNQAGCELRASSESAPLSIKEEDDLYFSCGESFMEVTDNDDIIKSVVPAFPRFSIEKLSNADIATGYINVIARIDLIVPKTSMPSELKDFLLEQPLTLILNDEDVVLGTPETLLQPGVSFFKWRASAALAVRFNTSEQPLERAIKDCPFDAHVLHFIARVKAVHTRNYKLTFDFHFSKGAFSPRDQVKADYLAEFNIDWRTAFVELANSVPLGTMTNRWCDQSDTRAVTISTWRELEDQILTWVKEKKDSRLALKTHFETGKCGCVWTSTAADSMRAPSVSPEQIALTAYFCPHRIFKAPKRQERVRSGDMGDALMHDEDNLEPVPVADKLPFGFFHYTVTIRRQPLLLTMLTVWPIMILCLVSLSIVWQDDSFANAVANVAAVLLALFAYSPVIRSKLPPAPVITKIDKVLNYAIFVCAVVLMSTAVQHLAFDFDNDGLEVSPPIKTVRVLTTLFLVGTMTFVVIWFSLAYFRYNMKVSGGCCRRPQVHPGGL